jgi:predicted CoA-binding protein
MEDPETIHSLLKNSKTIAIVGLSDKPDRDSNEVGRYLKSHGYRVIPVNPSVPEVLGERSYPSLQAIPSEVQIDIVDVFRKSDAVPGIVKDLLQRTPLPKALWLQLGVTDAPSGAMVRQHGVSFIEDQCIMVQHRAYFPR